MMMKRSLILSAVLLLAMTAAFTLVPSAPASGKSGGAAVGEPAPDFTLRDLAGRKHELAGYRGKITVIAFLATKCPISNDYNERVRAIAEEYGAKGIVFLGINASSDETVEMARAHAERNGFRFPLLKDESGSVADAYGAMRTPEIYIVDARGVIRYHGRIDNSRDPARASRHDLRAALDEMLAGKPVTTPETKAFGCIIKRSQASLMRGLDLAAAAQVNRTPVRLIKPAQYPEMVKETVAQGKVLVVNFWATWCGPCVAEFPEFVKLDKEYRAKGVRIVGISADEVSDLETKVVSFIKEKGVGFEIFLQDVEDPQEMIDVVDKKWEGVLPTTYIYDRKGNLALARYGIIDRDQMIQTIENALK